MSSKSTLVFVYNSFNDPLFQNIVFQYIKQLGHETSQNFHLITFEQREYYIDQKDRAELSEELSQNGIYWYPLQYAYGPVLIWNKFKNLIEAFQAIRRIKNTYHPESALSFGNVAAAFMGLLAVAFPMRKIIIQYEPHSEFLVELKRWKRKSIKYLLLSSLEKFATVTADVIMTGTQHMIEELEKKGIKAELFRTPNAVDERQFQFDSEKRRITRQKLAFAGKSVFLYIGKLGELYYEEELIQICSAIFKCNKNAHFLIITGYDKQKLTNWFTQYHIPNEAYTLMEPVPHAQVPDYLCAADMGVIAIPPTPAQRFRSPLKTAEYLYCGLPYIVCRGISEDDDYAQQHRIGVVINDFSEIQINQNYQKIGEILKEDSETRRFRCRSVALKYRSRQKVLKTLRTILKINQEFD